MPAGRSTSTAAAPARSGRRGGARGRRCERGDGEERGGDPGAGARDQPAHRSAISSDSSARGAPPSFRRRSTSQQRRELARREVRSQGARPLDHRRGRSRWPAQLSRDLVLGAAGAEPVGGPPDRAGLAREHAEQRERVLARAEQRAQERQRRGAVALDQRARQVEHVPGAGLAHDRAHLGGADAAVVGAARQRRLLHLAAQMREVVAGELDEQRRGISGELDALGAGARPEPRHELSANRRLHGDGERRAEWPCGANGWP